MISSPTVESMAHSVLPCVSGSCTQDTESIQSEPMPLYKPQLTFKALGNVVRKPLFLIILLRLHHSHERLAPHRGSSCSLASQEFSLPTSPPPKSSHLSFLAHLGVTLHKAFPTTQAILILQGRRPASLHLYYIIETYGFTYDVLTNSRMVETATSLSTSF